MKHLKYFHLHLSILDGDSEGIGDHIGANTSHRPGYKTRRGPGASACPCWPEASSECPPKSPIKLGLFVWFQSPQFPIVKSAQDTCPRNVDILLLLLRALTVVFLHGGLGCVVVVLESLTQSSETPSQASSLPHSGQCTAVDRDLLSLRTKVRCLHP